MNAAARIFHRKLAPWIMIPLAVTLMTGTAYRIGRSWFGMSKETGAKILDVHTGSWAGDIFSLIYVGVTGLCLIVMVMTGARLAFQSRSKLLPRRLHRWAGVVLMLPLVATASTGIAFHFGKEWFKIPDSAGNVLMMIHEGGWLGKTLKPYYVLLVGCGLAWLIITGLRMTGIFTKRRQPT